VLIIGWFKPYWSHFGLRVAQSFAAPLQIAEVWCNVPVLKPL